MSLLRDVGTGPVALDTVCFIYYIEEHPLYLPLVEPLFEAVAEGRLAAVTSAITLLEVLVIPLRRQDAPLAEEYERILTRSTGLTLFELDRGLLRAAALLRARSRLRTPDALQIAAALRGRATAFVSNDRDLSAVTAIPVLFLDRYL